MSEHSKGIIYICFGPAAAQAAQKSLSTIRKLNIDIPAIIIGTDQVNDTVFYTWTGNTPWYQDIHEPHQRFRAGEVKPFIYDLSPFDYTLYLDSDTIIYKDIMPGFDYLDKYDMCLVNHYGHKTIEGAFREPMYRAVMHAKKIEEREYTHKLLGVEVTPLINSGVIFFKKSLPCKDIFENWYNEWQHFKGWDEQMALHRAIHNYPKAKILYLPLDWNQKFLDDKTIIWHRMGKGSARVIKH